MFTKLLRFQPVTYKSIEWFLAPPAGCKHCCTHVTLEVTAAAADPFYCQCRCQQQFIRGICASAAVTAAAAAACTGCNEDYRSCPGSFLADVTNAVATAVGQIVWFVEVFAAALYDSAPAAAALSTQQSAAWLPLPTPASEGLD